MDFEERISKNNAEWGHSSNPFIYMVIDEQVGRVSWDAVRTAGNGKTEAFSGADPIKGGIDETVAHIIEVTAEWGLKGSIWVDYIHIPKREQLIREQPSMEDTTKAIALKYGESVSAEEWDELVHSAASNIASRANNGGLEDQIEFLIGEFGTDYLVTILDEP